SRLERPQGFGRLLERVGVVDRRTDQPFLVPSHDLGVSASRVARVLDAAAAPVDADDGDVLEQDAVGGDRGNPAGREADDEQAAFGGDALGRQVEDVAADRVVDDVDAAAAGERLDLFVPALDGVVDDRVGAEPAAEGALCVR